jgi:hypothetical protein
LGDLIALNQRGQGRKMNDEEKFDSAIGILLEALFEEFQQLSMLNESMRHAIGKSIPLKKSAQDYYDSLVALIPLQRYKNLQDQAIEAVRLHDASALVALIRQVRERVDIWGGFERT